MKRKFIIVIILLSILFYMGKELGYLDTPIAHIHGKARVHDGDSLRIGKKQIRLYGIDAPELEQYCRRDDIEFNCGIESRDYLIKITRNKEIHCQNVGIDYYKRLLSKCYDRDGNDINKKMVIEGMAFAYDRYYWGYVPAELMAKIMGNGFFANNIDIIEPQKWRMTVR